MLGNLKIKSEKNSQDKILITAYFITLNVFKKNISTRKSKMSKGLQYSTLSSSDKAKCNDLVQKVLRFTVYIDPFINRKKRGRIRIELFCILRLALTDIRSRAEKAHQIQDTSAKQNQHHRVAH